MPNKQRAGEEPEARESKGTPKRRSRRDTVALLLANAGLDSAVESLEALNKDEDGTHARLLLKDGTSYLLREYATTTRRADVFRLKETVLYASLRIGGLPVPYVLSSVSGDGRIAGDPPAMLLTDSGGTFLEQLFLTVPYAQRGPLWRSVGAALRRLHDLDVAVAGPLSDPPRRLGASWFVADFSKVLLRLRRAQPETTPAVDALLRLRPALREHLDTRPHAIRHGEGWYLPGMLMLPEGEEWTCGSWLGWGYYASVGDPMLDIVGMQLIHREWTGDEFPSSFYDAYGEQPDPVCRIVYESYLQLWRAPLYARNSPRAHQQMNAKRPQALATLRPPYATSLAAMHHLAETVTKLTALLD
ncbi:MAG: phosphotransferase [Pirellulales bacterium]